MGPLRSLLPVTEDRDGFRDRIARAFEYLVDLIYGSIVFNRPGIDLG